MTVHDNLLTFLPGHVDARIFWAQKPAGACACHVGRRAVDFEPQDRAHGRLLTEAVHR